MADHDKNNLNQLRGLIRAKCNIQPDIYSSDITLISQLRQNPGEGVLFIRIDDMSLAALKLTSTAKMFYPRVQIVWMSESDKHALEAFARGVDAYLLLPATRENIAETINCLHFKKQRFISTP